VGEATFCAALDAAVPQWREQREYPSLFAAFLRDGARTRRERIEDVVASALGRVPVWRALGAEADYCPARGCISAFWITVPTMLAAVALAWIAIRLLRRRRFGAGRR